MNEEFEALVLAVISEIPCGQVASYGQIAELGGLSPPWPACRESLFAF